MRHLLVPACLCLMTWSTATGPEPTPLSENFTGIATSKVDADSASGYETVVLPLAPLHTLLKPIISRSRKEICSTLAESARSNDLPAPFFIRLLYQESGFRPGAISSAGAMGVAQFMPETATDRGLDNPFDPVQAIWASARLLRDLYQKFGNLGLAAAAYNAGPGRVADWLAKKRSSLPQETRDYVKAITVRPVEAWTVAQAGSPAVRLPQDAPCQKIAGLLSWNGPDTIPLPPQNPRVKNPSGRINLAQELTEDRISDQRSPAQSGTKAKPPQRHHSLSTLSAMRDRCGPQGRATTTEHSRQVLACPESNQ